VFKLRPAPPAPAAAALLLVALGGCGGGGPASSPSVVPSTPAPGPTPTPSPTPVAGKQSCPLGDGSLDAACARTRSVHLGAVNEAMDTVVREHPGYFNLEEESGTGQYRVVDRERFLAAVIEALESRGFCAALDPTGHLVQVKETNELSEDYSLVTTGGFMRRGEVAYRTACTPASFPVDPGDRFAKMWVGTFSYRCSAGVVPPTVGGGLLPLGCDADVTATPKDKDLVDIPSWAHGQDVRWTLRDGQDRVIVDDHPDQPFNKRVYPRGLGTWSLCAELDGISGCVNGRVIP